MWSIKLFKLFGARKALALVGLLLAMLAAGCGAGPGYSGNSYGYTSGYGTAYPYNSGYGGYNGGYGTPYPYNGGYQNPYYQYQQNQATFNQQYQQNQATYNQQYLKNQQIYNQQYQKNLQTYNQRHPNNPVPPRSYPLHAHKQQQQ